MDKPIIRPVEAFPMEQQDQTLICLRDPSGLAPEPIMLGMGAYFLVTLFDGTNSTLDLQAAFSRRFGEIIPSEKIGELIATLDRAGFLDSPVFAERMGAMREEFGQSPSRAPAFAGLCYETEASRLRAEIESFFERPHAPGRDALAPAAASPSSTVQAASLAGLIAPHIDPRRGAAAYAWAYNELRRCERPELIVILGTSHYGAGPELFSATRKDYVTPLGAVPTDRAFVERLAARYAGSRGGDLFADEMLHRNEHSIEFQALFLAWALGVRGYQVAPILVSSFHRMVGANERPAGAARVARFLDALREELAAERRRVLILAGVDFAHVGRKFGDPFGLDDGVAERVRREDLALIETIKGGDPGAFFADIARDGDQRKICGLAPMYTQLELLSGRRARLLHYDIALEPQTDSLVSFASLAID
ncbi:MAG TPA: AmmeMemoRadiSam system protein B [Candidatus Binataceae bacterium]|nr:AmmeMemoRadiSam system protein B [Candidatus Binataceae bacterium]